VSMSLFQQYVVMGDDSIFFDHEGSDIVGDHIYEYLNKGYEHGNNNKSNSTSFIQSCNDPIESNGA